MVWVLIIFYLALSDLFHVFQTSKQSIGVGLLNHFSKQAVNVNGLDDRQQGNWRDIVLDQICQSLSDCEGGLQDCVRVALQSCPEVDYKSTVEVHAALETALLCYCGYCNTCPL